MQQHNDGDASMPGIPGMLASFDGPVATLETPLVGEFCHVGVGTTDGAVTEVIVEYVVRGTPPVALVRTVKSPEGRGVIHDPSVLLDDALRSFSRSSTHPSSFAPTIVGYLPDGRDRSRGTVEASLLVDGTPHDARYKTLDGNSGYATMLTESYIAVVLLSRDVRSVPSLHVRNASHE